MSRHVSFGLEMSVAVWIALRIGRCSKFENSGSANKSASNKSSKVSKVVEVAVIIKGACIKI
jgi:hypothetical protein